MSAVRSVLLIGAGGSVADCMKRPLNSRPPLDKGFFKAAWRAANNQLLLRRVQAYLSTNYAIENIRDPAHDSLERVMSNLYTDVFHPSLRADAYDAFLALLQVFNRQLAETTNGVGMDARRLLYRVIRQHLIHASNGGRLTIITFNQDIQIEKALCALDGRIKGYRDVFAFPALYGLGPVDVTGANSPQHFPHSPAEKGTVPLLKLHGSLNWYSRHTQSHPSPDSLLNRGRKLHLTRRRRLAPEMRALMTRRRLYTFPVVVPAVNHKGGILHERLEPIWGSAEAALTQATHVTIFGYSCPGTDFESEHLIQRSFRANKDCETLTIIDPDHNVVSRFIELTGMDSVRYYKNATRFLQESDAARQRQASTAQIRAVVA